MELRRLEDLGESIVQHFAYMRQLEEDMRHTNGNFSILSKINAFYIIKSLFQNLQIPACYIWAYFPCYAFSVWLPGKSYICADFSKPKNWSISPFYAAWKFESRSVMCSVSCPSNLSHFTCLLLLNLPRWWVILYLVLGSHNTQRVWKYFDLLLG